jgi:acylphosphatase
MGKRLLISGRVQGVGYRFSFAEAATALGLTGWVRNLYDGSVEACVHGDAAAIDNIVTWAKRGPPAACVSAVTVLPSDEPAPADGKFRILSSM